MVLAGGAWSRRFCDNLGIALPQLTVVNSVMRTEPIDTGLTRTCSGGSFTFRKRMDGGYTVTHNHFSVADIVPDSFRLFREFLPALMLDWKGLRLRLGKRFIEEARLKRRWALDEVSPFEKVRILDPEPVNDVLERGGAAEAVLPGVQADEDRRALGRRHRRGAGCGADHLEGREASGLPSVHRLLGPRLRPRAGCGQADGGDRDGEKTCVDPSPFRYSRFFDGSNPRPTTGL